MEEPDKQICVNVMKKIMSLTISETFIDVSPMASQFPQVISQIPNFESFPSILTKVMNDQFESIDKFSSYFENNLKMLSNAIQKLESKNILLLGLYGIAEELIIKFKKILKKYMMSDIEEFESNLRKVKKMIEELKEIRPSDYSHDKIISEQVVSFNPNPIPPKIFSI